MSQLPLELYRPICEFSHFEDLPNISVVSRAFQEEAERLLWWKLSIRGSVQETFARPERFLHFPRLHHYVQRLDLWIHREPHEESFPAVAVILLEKLTNLIALTIIGRDYCGEIFDNCTFQLHFLFTTFALDQNFAAFLQKQPSITEWRRTWQQSPPGDECDRLSPDILPNLTVFCNSNGESNFDVEIHNGRNLTHMSISRPSGPVSLAEFTRAASHIEALSLYCTPELLEVFPELLPNLECLSVIDYDAVEGDTFVSSILPRFQKLKALEIIVDSDRDYEALAYEMKVECPTLRHLQFSMDDRQARDFLDWDEKAGWWIWNKDSRNRLDLFDESARRTHSPLLPSFSSLIYE